MAKIFLSGHRDFGNRGCEAIVRSTVDIVRKAMPGAEFVVPSTHIERDRALWPEAETYGVAFRECLRQSVSMRVFGKARKRVEWLNHRYPPMGPPVEACRLIDECDAVLAVGGDNYSEDYSLPFLPLVLDRYAMDQGKPVVLWGASVGPFKGSEAYERFMAQHVQRYSRVHVRESHSEAYCRDVLGAQRVLRFADPAFALSSDAEYSLDVVQGEHIGVNISPVVLGKLGDKAEAFLEELMWALKTVQQRHALNVLLVPHVMAYAGPNDDRRSLRWLRERLEAHGVSNTEITDELNAAQLKTLIGGCRVFMGARTHSTIAAMSMGVPVISIGYSVKATGINELVFGDARYVMDYRRLQASALVERIEDALSTGGAALDVEARSQFREDAEAAGHGVRRLLEGDQQIGSSSATASENGLAP